MQCSKEFVVALGVLMTITGFGENRLNVNSPDPVWWFQDKALWSTGEFPTSADTAVYLGKGTKGSQANVLLKAGDDVTVNGTLTFGGTATDTRTTLTVGAGATLNVVTKIDMNPNQDNTTNLLDVAGGRVVLPTLNSGRKSCDHLVKVRDGGALQFTSTSYVGFGRDTRFLLDNGTLGCCGTFSLASGPEHAPRIDLRNGACLNVNHLGMGANTDGSEGHLVAVDSSIFVTNEVNVGRKSSPSIVLTNSTWASGSDMSKPMKLGGIDEKLYAADQHSYLEVGPGSKLHAKTGLSMYHNSLLRIVDGDVLLSQTVNNSNYRAFRSVSANAANTTQTVELVSGTFTATNEVATETTHHQQALINLGSANYGCCRFIQRGGTLRAAGLCLGSKDSVATPRYDIYGGLIDFFDAAGNDGGLALNTAPSITHAGIFSIHGGAPDVRAYRAGKYHANSQFLMEFVMMTNGLAPIKSPYSTSGNVNGLVYGFYDIVPEGGLQLMCGESVHLQEFANRASVTIEWEYNGKPVTKVPNPALWTTALTGQDATGTNTLASTLNAEAEIVSDVALAEPRHYGWVRLPRGKRETVRKVSVLLKLVPQGNETAATLAAGLTAAGYPAAAVADGEYNVCADIPVALLPERIENGRLLLDFHRCAHAEEFRDDTYAVSAKIVAVKVEKQGPGLMLLLR